MSTLWFILYELLTGSLPFDTQQLKKQPLDKLLRILREEDPPSPSTKVDAESDKTIESAALRGLQPAQLVTLLRGDLDWVTMKALERDRDRRYGSPSELPRTSNAISRTDRSWRVLPLLLIDSANTFAAMALPSP